MVRDASYAPLSGGFPGRGTAPEIPLFATRRLMPRDASDIAQLSCAQIERMSIPELAVIVREARLPLAERVTDALELYDAETLRRMAHLARRCCQCRTPLITVPATAGSTVAIH